jgi:hypothetical protein
MTIKTVGDLLDQLDGVDPDTPILIAINPAWPIEHAIGAVVYAGSTGVMYLADGGQVDYMRGDVRDELGWS